MKWFTTWMWGNISGKKVNEYRLANQEECHSHIMNYEVRRTLEVRRTFVEKMVMKYNYF